uniref:Uncharacterized protein n=1 Tax=Neogobius melanostomus TaxID=47308 RepID=A0A8C6SQ28_9GOBI
MSHAAVSTSMSSTRTPDGLLNLGYIRTIPGLLALTWLLKRSLLTVLCVFCLTWYAFQFFEVVALWFLVALLEFFHYCVGTVLVLIASIAGAVKAGGVSALVTATIFGFLTTFLMVVSLWTTYSVSCGSQQTGTILV